MGKQKLLVVEDEEDLCEILKFNLTNEGYHVDVANSAEEAINLPIEKYNLLLLDVMMGKMSGFKLAEKIRKERKLSVPIIFLTAKDTENDTLTGFSLGADDYISKPFSINEVIARVKAVLNRAKTNGVFEEELIIKTLRIDQSIKRVSIDNKAIKLTKTEFDILCLLAQNIGRIFSRDEIMANVWKDNVIVCDRTVDVNITRMRKKLGIYGKALVNRIGYGYCFDIDNI